ncbi:tetratricopeptide repeat protein [Nocardia nova]|uniref:tetratricopeptide repeat protein n=1 Tax=Nocardia nova TaxID=37330 RepID=UPI001E3482A3|nr:tetratricopeptide repeat protein [Nocardia nova]
MTSSDPGPRARLATELSQVRAQVGTPSYRAMAKVLAEHGKTDAVGETTLRNAAVVGEPTPKLTTVIQFVTACRLIAAQVRPGINDRFFDPELWYTRWKALGEAETTEEDDLLTQWKFRSKAEQGTVDPSWAGFVVALDEAGGLPRVSVVDPYQFGVTKSRYSNGGRYSHTDRDTASDQYVPRKIDGELAAATTSRRLTVLIGPSKAGKTRTLFEALTRTCPDARLLAPARETLDALPNCPAYTDSPYPIVVWLDDLGRFLTGTAGLTPGRLAHLLTRPAPTTVVATLRREEHDRFHDTKRGEIAKDVVELLRQATIIELESTITDPSEQAAAEAAYPDAGLDHYRKLGYGLGEVLAGAPAVLDRYDRAARNDPPLRAVIETTIDWARIGRLDEIPEPTLTKLAALTLRRNRPEWEPVAIRDAIREARTRVEAHAHIAALTTSWLSNDIRGYRAFDYLVAADDGQHGRTPRSIPESFWHTATYDADKATLARVGYTAHMRGQSGIDISVTRRAAEAGEPVAMHNLAVLLGNRGESGDAEAWYRKAAEAGEPAAMTHLGLVLSKRGDSVGAETWYRKAAKAGESTAMHNLGVLLNERGDSVGAETWYRKGAEAGHLSAIHNLGALLHQRGDTGDAEAWYCKAAEAGESVAMYNLGGLLDERGDSVGAETWYRRAAEAGEPAAMTHLGLVLSKRGDSVGAETWYRKAAEAGEPVSMHNLGVLLDERGDSVGAEAWFRKAAEAGDLSAMHNLGVLLDERGDSVGAEAWYRKAAEAGLPRGDAQSRGSAR